MKPLHYKKHTLAKRGLSLLCVLALCLGLLPVTVLAAGGAPSQLYVGNQNVKSGENTTYWATTESGRLTRVMNASDTSKNWNVKYDPNSATLTLSGATIQGGTNTESAPFGSGIYAQGNSNQPVSLTIELIGENTITGTFGIYVNANQGTTDASLVIKKSGDNGSLTVTGTGNSGLLILSGTGDASLTIKNASVDAKTTQTYSSYAGVCVQSGASATGSPQLSLAVNGGSLTASGTGNSDGILFHVGSSQATGATTSLTVTDHAIVDARNGGISASRISETLPTPTPAGNNSSGIVFDDKNGTVYGDVILDESLTIDQGETLTIGKDASLTVPSGTTLTNNGTIDNGGTLTNSGTVTNNGTINVEDGGKLKGTPIGGTVVNAPAITAQPKSQTVTEGQSASFTVAASGDSLTYQWQQSADNGTNWNNISGATSNSYTTEAATLAMNNYQYQCVVSNSAGSVTSNAATLTVDPVSVTGVTLNKTELALFTGDSETLTAKVEPADATNQAVTWSSDKPDVATVEGGKVTAVSAGTATITVTTADGNYTDTCTVNVTEPSYSITADTTAIDFGSAYTGYAQPAAQTVTITNDGNQPLTLTQPASTNRFEVGTLSTTALSAGDTATFTVQPKAGLSAGTYSDTITVTGNGGATLSITASFTVKSQPSYNPPTVSEETTDAIADAQPGETVTVDLSSGSTKLDKDVFEILAGRDVTLVIDLGDGVSWTVKGSDVPEDADFTDIDMGVTMGSDGIPVDLINAITGEHGSVQMTLAHNGAFGFTMTLTAPLGVENAGYWANLYYFDEDAEQLTFETAAEIDADGSVSLPMSHASQYAIVIDDHSHATIDLPFSDVGAGDWFYDPVCYVYAGGLMTGTSATEFDPEATTTRAMIVSMLARLEGVESAESAGFADVAANDWYATAVNWAAASGITSGTGDGNFSPNTAITREQLAAVLMNYAQYKGQDVSARATLDTYSDATAISSWANDVMSWAVAEGLLTGVTADTLQPQGAATRAQVAAILQRFLSE